MVTGWQPSSEVHAKTGTGLWNCVGITTCIPVAAATPLPVPLALKRAGATFWMVTGTMRRAAVPTPGGRPVVGNAMVPGPTATAGGM